MADVRKYDVALLDKMKQNQYETELHGVKILVKPIPEGGEDGSMDPRLYKSMKNMPLLMKIMPKPKKNATPLERILPFRKMFGEYKGRHIVDASSVSTERVTVKSADGYDVPVRVYMRNNAGEHLPMFVYYHGGGFFGGGADIVEQMCMLLVEKMDCVAFNVDYRLCPENHYPQPLDDCFYATKWAYENAERFCADKTRLFVSGDSAGGNLAAAVTLRDLDEGTGMVRAQLLIYPGTNFAMKHTKFYHGVDASKYVVSKRHGRVLHAVFGAMGGLTGSGPEDNLIADVYLQGHLPADHPYASPAFGDLGKLPPTLLLFGEHDFLVFDNFAYAQSLLDAGREVRVIVYRGMGHGFADQIGVAPQAEDCMEEIARFMQETL